MKRFAPWGFLAVLLLFSASLHMRATASPEAQPAPGLLALYDRRDVIDAPEVDFARVADIDSDGDLDILAVEPEQEDIHWWENVLGDGTEFVEHTVTTLSHRVTIVSPGDFDGDGDIDFLALAPERATLSLWLNDGSGVFTETGDSLTVPGTTYVEAALVNEDRYADFLAVEEDARDIDWWANNGQPEDIAFEKHQITTYSGAVTRVDAADIDGDELVDFVAANPDTDRITWWRHEVDTEGRHVFDQTQARFNEPSVIDVSAADVDGDLDLDIFALRSMPYRVFLWENTGDLAFRRENEILSDSPAHRPWRSLDSGDMNGDGAVDFVASEWGGDLCWYENPNVVQPTVTATASATGTAAPTLTPTRTTTPLATSTATATAAATVTVTPAADHSNYLPLVRRSP